MVKPKHPSLSFHEYFERENTSLFACQYDQRFSYYAYVPSQYDYQKTTHPLAVVVHGSSRTAETFRDAFADFAEETNTIILAPLFPGGIAKPRETDFYDFVHYGGIRYDDILFAMIEEMKEKYRIIGDKFLLFGYSSGGQFTHRFFYMHPDRLLGASIGAPGWVTYVDDTKPWYVGTQDFEERFGYPLPIEQMKQVPVQMVIGSEDTSTLLINDKSMDIWMDGLDAKGKTRLERLDALRENYENLGISVRYDVVPGIGHDGSRLLGPVKNFFTNVLKDNGYIREE